MLSKRMDTVGVATAIIVAVIVVVAVGGVLAYVYLYDPGSSETPYSLQVGDYVEYDLDYVEDPQTPHSNISLRLEVVEISEFTMTINYTNNLEGYVYSQLGEVPINQTLLLTYDLSDAPPGYDVTSLGRENVATEWGTLSTDHLRVEYQHQGKPMVYDLWMKKGVPIKVKVTYNDIPQSTWMIIDTNLEFITA
ncbi:MAG: hypothetical protein A4E30_00213 [Methanomassiliicoccales archaeon PtaB.Bin215]|nr:MAG: hypothetical protein A4E30_00213 [Methanomassiliicoccales archaeon PtaB.Bin215]